MRKQRKDEHIQNYLKTEYCADTLFRDIYLEPAGLTDLDFSDINTETEFFGKKVAFPLMINAMTGGTEMTESINQDLSLLARTFNLPMQVGSQSIALENPESRESFEIVRAALTEDNVLLANLSATASVEEAKAAMEMIQADGIGFHLNTCQELVMAEGDRNFRGLKRNIKELQEAFGDKMLVKEVGFGMSQQTVEELVALGVQKIDISGSGGTNFIEIEDLRNQGDDFSDIYHWGVPTAKSLLNARAASSDVYLIASGGIKSADDLIRSLIIGADMTAMSGELLRYLVHGGYNVAKNFLESLIYKSKVMMLLLGAKDLEALKKVPYKIIGGLKERMD